MKDMKITITSLLVPAAILLLAACDVKDPIHDPEPPVKVTVLTEELPALTVKRDSFVTSSPRMLLLGQTDDITGVTRATPYFTLSPPSGAEVRADHVYDSLTFFARGGGTVWGDTTYMQQIHLYRLRELPPSAPVFNNATVPHEAEPLGSFTFWPGAGRVPPVLRFRLDKADALGQEMLAMLAAGSSVMGDAAKFREYLKGLVVMADPSNTCISTLDPSAGGMGITLHWHDGGGTARSCSFVSGAAEDAPCMFMNTVNSPAGTPYSVLQQQTDALPFADAARQGYPDGQAVVCGAGGYMVRMELPDALPGQAEGRTPAKVEIRWHVRQPGWYTTPPAEGEEEIKEEMTNTPYPLPAAVRLYETDGDNRMKAAVTDAEGKPVDALLTDASPTYAKDGIYTADITHYYLSRLSRAAGQGMVALLAGVPVDELTASAGLMVMDSLPEIRVHWHEPAGE